MPASTTALATVRVSALDVRFGTRQVLHDLDLTVPPGRRTGLVGENGSGKSTLLRALAGTLPSRAVVTGVVDAPDDLVMLGQEPPFPDDATVGEVLARALSPLRRMVADVERLSADLSDEAGQTAYAAALDLAVAHDAWDADRRAAEAAERLGLGALEADRRIGTLSGGQRTRLALATVMMTRPACLLLDEPTNHLDDEAVDLLTTFLRDLPGVVVLASHDRVLLDEVCTDLFDLDPVGARHRRERRASLRRRLDGVRGAPRGRAAALGGDLPRAAGGARPAARRDDDRDVGDRPRPAAAGQRQVHLQLQGRAGRPHARPPQEGRRTAAEIAEREQVRKPRPPLSLRTDLTCVGTSGRVVQVRDLQVAGRLRLDRLDVDAGEHLLVSGANGSGKSTLLGVLSGRIAPTSGTVSVAARRVAELVQDVRFDEPGRSARATYDVLVGAERAARTPLRTLGLLPATGTRPRSRCSRSASAGGSGLADRRGLRARPAAARRADEPHLAGAGRRAGGGPADHPGHRRRGQPRPLAAPALGRPRAGPAARASEGSGR